MRNPISALRGFLGEQSRRARRFVSETIAPESSASNSEAREESNPDEQNPSSHNGQGSSSTLDHAVAHFLHDRGGGVRQLRAVFDDTDGQPGRHPHERAVVVSTGEWDGRASDRPPDVVLDVSELEVGEIHLAVEELEAHVALNASIAELVDINVGASVELGEVELDINDVEAEARLEVHLQEVRHILTRALYTLEQRPELITKTFKTTTDSVEEIGSEVSDAAGELGDELGDTAKQVTSKTGQWTRQARKAGKKLSTKAKDVLRRDSDDAQSQDPQDPSIRAQSRAEYDD